MLDHIQTTHITTPRTARLAFLGTPDEAVTDVWIVLHGYRQLAPYFLAKFNRAKADHRLIVAPEGLSRFYLPGHQRVGASWMTKEERLLEIRDQREYLNRVFEWIQSGLSPSIRLHTLGFSQGMATLWRWLRDGGINPASITVWTGSVPMECPPDFSERLSQIPVWAFYASEDEFFTIAQSESHLEKVKTFIPHMQVQLFEGKHDIDRELIVHHMNKVEGM